MSDGLFKCIVQDNFESDPTIGNFKLSVDKKGISKHKKIEKTNIFIENLRQYIMNSPDERHFYDFKIVAQDGLEIRSHKIILASQTQYFNAMFRQENAEFVNLDFSSDIIKICVDYLYTENIDVTGDNVHDIMVFANYVMIMDVVKICQDFICNNLDLSNCFYVFEFGDVLGNSTIVEEAKNLICRNFQTLFHQEEKLRRFPLHLFKQVVSSDELILPGIEREEMLAELVEKYCALNNMENDDDDVKTLLRNDQKKQIRSHRELSHLVTWTPQ